MVRRTVVRSLVRAGYQVLSADSGQSALALLREHPFDVVASDVTMPEMDGLALLAAICAMLPSLPVILLSGSAPEAASTAGAFRFLQKPIAEAELLAAIAEAVAVAQPPG